LLSISTGFGFCSI